MMTTKYTVECDRNVTVMATEDYFQLNRVAEKAQGMYWRGFVTGGVIFTVGWVVLALLVLAGRC